MNQCLYAGPPLTEKIADTLMRFRTQKIALVRDIEKAFHMMSVVEDDRNVLRFLWFHEPKTKELDGPLISKRHPGGEGFLKD